jgi:hypothetical protein
MPNTGLICSQCNDVADVVTPLNGTTLLAKTMMGEIIVALHTRCEGTWAEKNNCERLVPLRRCVSGMRAVRASAACKNAVEKRQKEQIRIR